VIKKGNMEKTQRIIVMLLAIAILFSFFSIVINLSVSNIDFPESVAGKVVDDDSAGVSLYVEKYSDEGEDES
jgi:hypothetical protein